MSQQLEKQTQRGMTELARVIVLVGGIIALLGGVLGLVGGFFAAGSALALVVGIVALLYYGRLGSQEVVVVLLVLGLVLAVITGGLSSIGGILVGIGALISLIVRYAKV
jgi:hypothetical protein